MVICRVRACTYPYGLYGIWKVNGELVQSKGLCPFDKINVVSSYLFTRRNRTYISGAHRTHVYFCVVLLQLGMSGVDENGKTGDRKT